MGGQTRGSVHGRGVRKVVVEQGGLESASAAQLLERSDTTGGVNDGAGNLIKLKSGVMTCKLFAQGLIRDSHRCAA